LIGALDDLDAHALEDSLQCILEACAPISTIGVELQEKRIWGFVTLGLWRFIGSTFLEVGPQTKKLNCQRPNS
jgi:hypothetical protein